MMEVVMVTRIARGGGGGGGGGCGGCGGGGGGESTQRQRGAPCVIFVWLKNVCLSVLSVHFNQKSLWW